MDIRLQAKLLRALQEREIDRLGGAAPVRVNVRILATTNRDLMAEVQRGAFREDLYFRLNVVSLRIPPLRERPGDIAALAEHFARRYADVNGLPFRPLSREALLRLASHGVARQCARAGERRSTARCCSPMARRSASRRSSSGHPAASAQPSGCRRHRLAGRPPDGGGGARSDHRDARATRWATARMRRPSSASRSARCATSCATTRRTASRCRRRPPAWRREVTCGKGPLPQPPPAREGDITPPPLREGWGGGATAMADAIAALALPGLTSRSASSRLAATSASRIGVVALLSVLILPLPTIAARPRPRALHHRRRCWC